MAREKSKTKTKPKTKWFHYIQNNSGGRFVFNERSGITHHVFIEAHNAEEADERAMSIGIYFDGCDIGDDCHCCGDRWYRAYDSSGTDTPQYYNNGKDIRVVKPDFVIRWTESNPECVIHPMNEKFKFLCYPPKKKGKRGK